MGFKKIFRNLIIGVMIATTLLPSCYVYGYDSSKEFKQEDVSTWNQGSNTFIDPSDGVSWNDKIYLGTSTTTTIHQAGCGYYSCSYMMVKNGFMNPKEKTPIDFVRWANSGDNTELADWHFNFSKITDYDPDLECIQKQASLPSNNISENITYIKGKMMQEDFYVIVCLHCNCMSSQHYIFIDGFDGDDMVIGDSGFAGTKWSDHYGKCSNVYMSGLWLFKSKSGKKPSQQPSIYSDQVLSGNTMTNSEVSLYKKIKDEWEIDGMPKKFLLSTPQCDLSDVPELSAKQQSTVAYIRENIKAEKEDKIWSFIQAVISFVGLILMLYGVLMVLAYIFDRSDLIFGLSLMGILTLGKYKVQDDNDYVLTEGKEKKINGVTYLTKWALFKRVLILEIVGGLLVTKVLLFNLIMFVLEKVGMFR